MKAAVSAPFRNAGAFGRLGLPGPPPLRSEPGFSPLGNNGTSSPWERRCSRPLGPAVASASSGRPGRVARSENQYLRSFGNEGAVPLWECRSSAPLLTPGAAPLWDHRGLRSFGNAGSFAPFQMGPQIGAPGQEGRKGWEPFPVVAAVWRLVQCLKSNGASVVRRFFEL